MRFTLHGYSEEEGEPHMGKRPQLPHTYVMRSFRPIQISEFMRAARMHVCAQHHVWVTPVICVAKQMI